jgi:hypothetical protein
MITDREWNIILEKAYPTKTFKAPAFLWTRILALIESEESRRAATWWMQWRWMGRVTATIALFVTIGTFYLMQRQAIPLDAALDGRTNQETALQIATSDNLTPADTAGVVVGLDS